jgi:predicted mannosyl-3-phosphoglycerate phosphatase (HAD superfamily)
MTTVTYLTAAGVEAGTLLRMYRQMNRHSAEITMKAGDKPVCFPLTAQRGYSFVVAQLTSENPLSIR